MTLPKSGGPEWADSQATPNLTVNESLRRLDAGLQRWVVVDRDLSAPPGSCSDGANYLVASSGSGAWSGQTGKLATAIGANASNGWKYTTVAVEGNQLYLQDEDLEITYNGSAWAGTTTTGKHTVPIMAAAMTARTTSGAASGTTETTSNKVMFRTLDFDQSTDEFAQFAIPMPKSWNEGTVTAQFVWTAGVTGNVVWGIQAVALSNDDPLDGAFGSAVTVTDGVTAADDLMFTAETSAVTIGGTPVEGDLVVFQVYRDADNGSDTAAGDAKLVAVNLFITYNAANDA
jgi:hypothetical protein